MTMRRLPDGRYTESVDEYLAAWDALAAPLATLGWVLSSYDPGLVLHDEQGHIVALKVHQAQRIGDALRRSEQDLRDALRQSDAWRSSASRHWRMREDFERELGLTPAVAAEDSVAQGLAAIRALKAEVEQLRDERAVLRAGLVACRSWVGVCPWPGTPAWSKVIAVRELADDMLEETKP